MHSFTYAFKHPKPFYLVWFIELWERFGFYGMQAILVLYLIQELGFSDSESYSIFGAFSALLYALTSVGGYIGDYVLGTKRTILIGAIFLFLGYFLLTISNEHLIFHGLGIVIIGNGLFKANPASLLAKLYKQDDPRIDGAFTLYYMSINLGSFVSITATPFVAKYFGWNIAFSVSAIGLLIGIINYLWLVGWAKDNGSAPDFQKIKLLKLFFVIAGSILGALISGWLLENLKIAHLILLLSGLIVLGFFIKVILNSKGQDRANLIASLVLILQAVIFFILYQQMPTSINLFTVRNIDTVILGYNIPPAAFQALNPLWIILASPILAYFYSIAAKKGNDLSLPAKFTLGMFLCSMGFLTLKLSSFFANSEGIISAKWLVLSYSLQSTGELLVSGLGCAMIARLCPQPLMGFMMGAWFMSSAIAMALGGEVASIASIPKNITNPLLSLSIYSNFFFNIGIITLLISIVMAIFTPGLTKLCLKANN